MTQGVSMEPLIFLWPKRIFSDTDTLTLSTRIFRKVAPVQVAMNQTRECTQHNVPWFFLGFISYIELSPPPGALTVQNWLWWLVGGGENRITQLFFLERGCWFISWSSPWGSSWWRHNSSVSDPWSYYMFKSWLKRGFLRLQKRVLKRGSEVTTVGA